MNGIFKICVSRCLGNLKAEPDSRSQVSVATDDVIAIIVFVKDDSTI